MTSDLKSNRLASCVCKFLRRSRRLAYVQLAPDLTIVEVSPNLNELVAATAEDVVGRPLTDFFWEFIGSEESLMAVLRGESASFRWEWVNSDLPNGSTAYRTFEVILLDEDEPAAGLVFLIEDTTAHSVLEQVVMQDRNEVRLSRARLAALNAELQRLSRFKTAVLSIAAQDAQTPLAVVRLTADLLLKEPARLSDDQRRYTSLIRAQADKLVHIINGLLDLDQIEAGKLQLNLADCDLQDLVHKVTDAQTILFVPHQLNLELHFPDAPVKVQADADRIEHVIYDVLSCAVHYALADSRIEVRLDIDGRRAQLQVRYGGHVLTPAEMDELFQTYYQAEAARRTGYLASGLGLLVAKAVVEAHGGQIDVTPAESGMAFTVWLPLSEAG